MGPFATSCASLSPPWIVLLLYINLITLLPNASRQAEYIIVYAIANVAGFQGRMSALRSYLCSSDSNSSLEKSRSREARDVQVG